MAIETISLLGEKDSGFVRYGVLIIRYLLLLPITASYSRLGTWGVLVLVILRRIRVEKLNGRHRLLYDDVPWY